MALRAKSVPPNSSQKTLVKGDGLKPKVSAENIYLTEIPSPPPHQHVHSSTEKKIKKQLELKGIIFLF